MFSIRAPGAFAVLVACLQNGCSPESAAPPNVWHDEATYRWRELSAAHGDQPGFTELSAEKAGIRFVDDVPEDSTLQNRYLAIGSGVALGDVDGDGLVDIFLARVGGPSALYKNLGNWKFTEITAGSHMELKGRNSFGATLVDIDGDGDLDLLVTALGGPNGLFLNDGHARFTEVTDDAGVASHRGSTTATLADVDGDGDLDLYIANYKAKDVMDIFPPQERYFDQVVRRTDDHFEVAPRFREHYRVEVRPDLGAVVRIQRAEPDWFYLNEGHGKFTHIPFTSGRFLDEDGKPLSEEPDRFGLTARFFDANGDGYPDLYVCNDFEDPDQFWLNDGTGSFRAAPRLDLRSSSNSSMAMDFSDIDRDGNPDLFVVDMLSRDSRRRKTQSPTHTPMPKGIGVIDDRPQMQRNTMFLSRGDGTYAEIAGSAGVDASDWSWSSLFLDVDLDGYEDLLIGTGHVWDVMDSDTWEQIKTSLGAKWHDEFKLFPKLPLKNVAFHNNRDLTFTEVGEKWHFASEPAVTHGMAAADLDGDGDLDLVTNRLDRAPGVFRNDATAPRVAVRLLGLAPNTEAVGSRIQILAGKVPVQQKEVTVGGLYLSSSDPLYTFATAGADTLTISVLWRYGQVTTLSGVRANREYEIREPERITRATASKSARRIDSAPPLFLDVSNRLRHTHVETPFDDYSRQPLLANKLSQLGPGLTWYDVDGNGSDDLLIGSGKGGRLALFENKGGRLTRHEMGGSPTASDQTTILVSPDGHGGNELVVGQSSYEAATPDEALALPSVVAVPLSRRGISLAPQTIVIPGDTASVGPLALADYDGDGDLDLFVGGRVMPGAYPVPVSSHLYHFDRGVFVRDTANQYVLDNIGMISAALFSDIDGDGQPDLLLAPEWGYLRVFLNRGGHFIEAPSSYGLRDLSSRWNGIATGDLNGDGRLDIVATSWGRNTKYHVSRDSPLLLYFGNLDDNGSLDVLEAQRDSELGQIAPLETLSRLGSALPYIRQNVRTFAEYSSAPLRKVVGLPLEHARRLEVNDLDHVVFINDGTHFVASPLPPMAQIAPAFYAGIADFNGDGREDIFLSQNFFPTEIGTPRYDAGLGLLLLGNGRGGLTPMSDRASGIAVFGDQRGAAFADFNRDGRIDLAVSQNGAATKLYENVGAKKGLIVQLIGPASNPSAIGALIRVGYSGNRYGPAREVQAGSGYWSMNSPVQVMGLEGEADAVWVRWPGGAQTTTPIRTGEKMIRIQGPSGR
ncbi:MAG TPA: FG-GAP-like repeat-containing protein [Gemmatimonadaceae bacterium]|nr:FG-GAP-like repeat-containing protein [Gemmatimonadaceae bacterium]